MWLEPDSSSARPLLFIDAVINLVLGCLLIVFPTAIVELLGMPGSGSTFYPSILGAVLFGIGIALIVEILMGSGLGLLGAVAINLSGGFVLAVWLLLGDLAIPARGHVLLWTLVVILLGISTIELAVLSSKRSDG